MCEDGETTNTMTQQSTERARMFSTPSLQGPWTALRLTRAQFFAILLGATLVYVFTGGPLWSHLRENDFDRITISYLVIPATVALALYRNHELRVSTWLAASGVIAAVKLLLTAGLALVLGIAAG